MNDTDQRLIGKSILRAGVTDEICRLITADRTIDDSIRSEDALMSMSDMGVTIEDGVVTFMDGTTLSADGVLTFPDGTVINVVAE